MAQELNVEFIGYTQRLGAITVDVWAPRPGIVREYLPATLESGFAYFDVGTARYRIPAAHGRHVAEPVQVDNAAAQFVANVAMIDKALAAWIGAEIAAGASVEAIRERIGRAYGAVAAERAERAEPVQALPEPAAIELEIDASTQHAVAYRDGKPIATVQRRRYLEKGPYWRAFDLTGAELFRTVSNVSAAYLARRIAKALDTRDSIKS